MYRTRVRNMGHCLTSRRTLQAGGSHADSPPNDDEQDGLSTDEKVRFTRAFARFDANGDGFIDQKEMMHLLEEQAGKPTEQHNSASTSRLKACREVCNRKTSSVSKKSAEEMRGWMGLTADEDVALDGFLKMLARLKRKLAGSAHDQQCEPLLS